MQRRRLVITGQVQGVGFRPFVYNLAQQFGLTGHVANTTSGVVIEIQGPAEALAAFVAALPSRAPRLARAEIAADDPIKPMPEEASFVILASHGDTERRVLVTPDAATCPDCLHELADPADRRYRYPFINCTNCGPRYTIIRDVPYDRPNTTMAAFTMCPDCRREYDNPADRRFHAQPNACPVCGPRVWLTDPHGKPLAATDPITKTVALLVAGKIVAIKGLGGFHLACRADNDKALITLRQRKYRKAKAFALMVCDLGQARRLVRLDTAAEKLLADIERPIVLCPKLPGGAISRHVAPASRYFGVMLPYTPLHTLLMAGPYPALVMTSGNLSDEPIESENAHAVAQLGPLADALLLHDRDIYTACDDSVVRLFNSEPMMLRRARGYAPRPLPLKRRYDRDILAVGAELKNTVTFLKGEHAFVSQHIGNLQDAGVYEAFTRTIEKLAALIEARPAAVACDLHPTMLSTRWAEAYQDAALVRVQHHHAHVAAVMGEHNLDEPVLGITGDGLGWGADQTIWGCEILLADRRDFTRRGYLGPLPQPGGDQAARQPWRMAVSALVTALGRDEALRYAEKLLPTIDADDRRTVAEMADRRINAPLTSSLGRLCDAAAALLGVCLENTYDAQGPIELEYLADPTADKAYPYELHRDARGAWVLSPVPIIRALAADSLARRPAAEIAGRFHHTIVTALADMALRLAQETGVTNVALSGGAFQNELLLGGLINQLQRGGLTAYFNQSVPINDGGISFGQAVVADARLGG